MAQQATVDQIQYLFTFPFNDPAWKRKFLIGFLLYMAGFIVPVIPWLLVTGYIAKIAKIGVDGDEFYLPDWDDWGELLNLGFRWTAAGFIVLLPTLLLFVGGYFLFLSPIFGAMFAPPSYGDKVSATWSLMALLGPLGGMCAFGLAMLVSLLTGFLFPPAIGHIVAEDRLEALVRVREWWAIFKANMGGYVISYLLIMGTAFLLMFVVQFAYLTIILCCLIPFLLSLISIYLGILIGALIGQTYRVGKTNLAIALSPTQEAESDELESI